MKATATDKTFDKTFAIVILLGSMAFSGMVGYTAGQRGSFTEFKTEISEISEPLIDVKIIEVHHYGDTYEKNGFWREASSYAIYERVDTGERILSCKAFLGKAGETIKVKINYLNESCG